MKNYFRVMLGAKSAYAALCREQGFIGADYQIAQDLSADLFDNWRDFNQKYRPIFLDAHPEKTMIGAGLACGALWTVAKGIQKGDMVLCPNGSGTYFVGEVASDYFYVPGQPLPHRRSVNWLAQTILRDDMSDALKNSTGSIGTVSTITPHAVEIEKLLGVQLNDPVLVASDPDVEDAAAFAMEKHLEDFLVKNWAQTELGKDYDIYAEDGEPVGQQYPTDTGPMDLLAVKKDKSELLVVELKRGKASDVVVGQVLRYMGFVKEDLAESHQAVRGAIIALEDDLRIRRALAVTPSIQFFRYQISFKLVKT
ncbi:endonuclease NucS [Acidovorax delafieldii]|uniref:endonuclease NucS domain-containing protein n=1 Tax=Acidovorax delafieldii TaxID=47920 RepID=UPI003ECD34EA